MKNYKEFEKICIGSSDIASLILVGYKKEIGLETQVLSFGIDETYYAYVVTEKDVEIGSHYELKASYDVWLKIYDDDELVRKFEADKILVYRAKEMGCIIHLINN